MKHTTFKAGGYARYFAVPDSIDKLSVLISVLKENNAEYLIMGNGSNMLVSDKGYDGVVVNIGKKLSAVTVDGERITAQAGALLSSIASAALANSLEGFEFASGIPGSLGGAVAMNAGAYGGEMKDVILKTEYIDADGCMRTVIGDEHNFGYRRSRFENGEVILSSVIELKRGNRDAVKSLMDELNSKRREKQPLNLPSAGSTFKRPEGYFAAKLIDDAGLRGYRVGGACVSDKHCGFIVNTDGASSSDIYELIKHVRKTVYDKFNVYLETEVKLIGDFE